ncbi:MAG: bifunctional riboflavin kinase/FAD synthetase [Epsilonproteobacteria bacterium]|nr:bifunctional riboflavin kinase/FAD synthetase [Campylobacterota bacterium]
MRLAIGGFDGVHLAHQELLKYSDEVIIIQKHPTLTPCKEMCEYIDKPCHFYLLDEIKHLTALQFVHILKNYNPSLIVVGYDFRFGKDRAGDIALLRKFFNVKVIDEIKLDGISIHANVIRQFIKDANITMANKLLNHPYRIKGRQIVGQGLGAQLLPTINLKLECDYTLPKDGVYITRTDNQPSITFIGTRSTDAKFAIETHILQYRSHNETITIEFFEFLRENRKFNSLNELKQAIISDKKRAIEYWRR